MSREDFIKGKIKEKGLTLKDYAKSIGMPYSTLLSMLSGNIGGASIDNVIKICNGLGISVSTLQEYSTIEDMNAPFELSEREKLLILQYRSMPEMQPAVNKLLDLKR